MGLHASLDETKHLAALARVKIKSGCDFFGNFGVLGTLMISKTMKMKNLPMCLALPVAK